MSTLITTCPRCGRTHEESIDATEAICPKCSCRYMIWDYQDETDPEFDPDYGGTFDGHTVHSDADPGL